MAEILIKYSNLIDRKEKIAGAEATGYVMLHDNFVKGWEHGQEPKGTMTFETAPVYQIPPVKRGLFAELDELRADIEELKAR